MLSLFSLIQSFSITFSILINIMTSLKNLVNHCFFFSERRKNCILRNHKQFEKMDQTQQQCINNISTDELKP